MRKKIDDPAIWVIYGTIALLGVAYGTSIAVLAVHMAAHGIPKVAMGGLATVFALGIISLSIPAGWLVKKAGAKVVLIVALGGYAACVASFPYLGTLTQLSIARFFDGAFSVCIWVAAETALLARARREHKGLVMSLYAIALAIGYVVGPIISRLVVRSQGTNIAFLVAGGLGIAAALVTLFGLRGGARPPAAERDAEEPLATGEAESEEEGAASRAGSIAWRIKTSCLATFSYGYFQASVVLFLPLYLIEAKSIPEDDTILITAFFAAGMLVMSSVAGRLGDRHGHLLLMRVLGAIGGAMVAAFVVLPSFATMCAAVFVAGATLASISPVSLALQGVVTKKADLERANAFYNAAYAAGMLVGPPISSVFFTRMGGGAMLMHLAGLWAIFVAFTTIFAADDPRHSSRRATRADATLGA
ncbi:MAG: MFS transporter [Deltaproteobacteria bacterium]|nr:MFS transporter [Deltaproteobacteria bacterium]